MHCVDLCLSSSVTINGNVRLLATVATPGHFCLVLGLENMKCFQRNVNKSQVLVFEYNIFWVLKYEVTKNHSNTIMYGLYANSV